jgi:hypothetical protein
MRSPHTPTSSISPSTTPHHRQRRPAAGRRDCTDDANLLRCGATSQVLGHRVMAPSTLGTFLRAFTFGHIRQLDRLTKQTCNRRGRPAPDPATPR